ncbi:Dephospho-CoA kinase [Saezia sanguinis]|uniref:Dephospho-CoA kinase n=1 Tax=Saezia sanguinis TaxID=1965230 RepID=A0A433SC07_9BURK|nr:dephospho-CoA kinase [Saezia sanguinis]RUS66277.1 Dephospho-CoA kinase [Saezia sanguinis]
MTILRAGLTGGIGSGKSTVSAMFQRLGVPVIDTDQISRHLTQLQGAAIPHIRAVFGHTLFDADGSLSRQRLRELIFGSPAHKKQLEGILHPLIREEAEKQFTQYAHQSDVVIFDIPLLAPGSVWLQSLQRILVIDSQEQTQIQRVVSRSGWSAQQVKAVIAQQASREQRLSIATDVIVNDHITLDQLERQVQGILDQWRQPGTV